MSRLRIEATIHFDRRGKGSQRVIQTGGAPRPTQVSGRVPRVSRLMALAIHWQSLIDEGFVTDYAEIARLGNVTRARVSQIMNLLLLAPDIQEALLFLPRTQAGSDRILLSMLQPIALVPDR